MARSTLLSAKLYGIVDLGYAAPSALIRVTAEMIEGGIAGTTFFVDPALDMYAMLMIQAPNQRDYYRPLFRDLVYAALQ